MQGLRSRGTVNRRLALLIGLAVLVALPAVPSAAGVAPVAPPAVPSTPAAPAAFPSYYAGSFASRAGYDGALPTAALEVGPADGNVLVAVTFRASDPSFFAPPAPGSAPLSFEQIADRWGLTPTAYAAAESYFTSAGLSVVRTSPDRLSMTVAGPAPTVGRAFGTTIDDGVEAGRPVTFPSTAPVLPSSLEAEVADVAGLSTGFDTFSLPNLAPSPAIAQSNQVTPAIARNIYGLSSLYNVSGVVAQYPTSDALALLLWGDGYAPSDISTFFDNYYPSSFPAIRWSAYPVDGAPTPSASAVNDPSKAPQELTLDMEWAGSMAPGVMLDAVYAPDGPAGNHYSPTDATMIDALNTAIGLPSVRAVSMSFGTSEATDSGLAGGFGTAFATATQRGITLLAATGDTGGDTAVNPCSNVPEANFPSTSPDVLAVGGTQVNLNWGITGTLTGFSETAWSEGGGGYSSGYAVPSWQTSIPTIASDGHRGIPDVAATSALNFVYYDGQVGNGAGTSFATPLWAGLIVVMDAHAGTPLGLVSPRIYVVAEEQSTGKKAVGFNDITGGGNCVASAGPGWDAATGWGSPSALLLYEDLTATFVNLTVAASPSPVAPGTSVTVITVLTNRSTGHPIAGVPVEVDLDADSAVGPCLGRFATSTVPSNATGVVAASLGVPACYLGSHAVVTVTVTSNGLYGSNSTTVAVNLLGLVPALRFLNQSPYNVVGFVVIMAAAATLGGVLGRRRPPSPGRAPPAAGPPTGATGTYVAPPAPPPTGPSAAPGPEAPSSPPP